MPQLLKPTPTSIERYFRVMGQDAGFTFNPFIVWNECVVPANSHLRRIDPILVTNLTLVQEELAFTAPSAVLWDDYKLGDFPAWDLTVKLELNQLEHWRFSITVGTTGRPLSVHSAIIPDDPLKAGLPSTGGYMPAPARATRPGRPRTRFAVSWSGTTYEYICTCREWGAESNYCIHVKEHFDNRHDAVDYNTLRKGAIRTFHLPLYSGKAMAPVIVTVLKRSDVFKNDTTDDKLFFATHKNKTNELEFFLQPSEGFKSIIATLEGYYASHESANALWQIAPGVSLPAKINCTASTHTFTVNGNFMQQILSVHNDKRAELIGAHAFYLANYSTCKICFDLGNDFDNDAPEL